MIKAKYPRYLFILLFTVILGTDVLSGAVKSSPVTADATESARKLYSFMAENFGRKTISGIMTGDNSSASTLSVQPDVKAVLELDGNVMPALVGFDFLMTTGKKKDQNWYLNFTSNVMSMAKELWNKGGIPAFCWHWRDPGYTTENYKNTIVDDGSFDFEAAFIQGTDEWDTESDEYKCIIRDIDIISDKMLELQSAGVAVLWRPLHEAAGQWFWWSALDGEKYVALYHLLYDRMVNVNGVHNCLWVWNIERSKVLCQELGDWTSPATLDDSSWFPGFKYVDIIGVDVYKRGSNTAAADYYRKIVELWGKKRIIAFTETDYIPDMDDMLCNMTIWSYWMPWDNSWSGMFKMTTESVWKSNMNHERVITLDDMPGWDNYVVRVPEVSDDSESWHGPSVRYNLDGRPVNVANGKGIFVEYGRKYLLR